MLLDTAALYFRAFHGVPDTVRSPDGRPVNAVRGLLDMIARLTAEFSPTHLVACWDDDWRPRWRVDLIPSYKAHRVAPEAVGGPDVETVPDPLEAQVPVIREVLAALGIAIVGAAEHEADDVIGTLAATADMPVDVVTGDRDLFQVVDDARAVRVVYTGRGMARLEVLDDAAVLARHGVHAAQYADLAALRGDPSDGLPGIAGIGEKTAAQLLAKFGDLDGIRAAASDPSSPMAASVRAKLEAASDYLDVAPSVVEVVRDLALAPFDAGLRPLSPEQQAELARLSAEHGIGTSVERVIRSLSEP
ncbi:5'-3' exonuclease [Microbacterium sp.]|uniref:5'-3' exonuclease n=1 Tax=Microbacterium sp. TaxID=51671 RepID=UPI0039E5668D